MFIFGHFLAVNNRRYGRCYQKIIVTYFPPILHSTRIKFSKIVSKRFLQVFKGFRYYVSKNIVFLMNVVIFQPIEPQATLCQNILNALRIFARIAINFVAFTKPNKHKKRSEGFSTTWPNSFSNSFAIVGEF